jgi:hypothetical protein
MSLIPRLRTALVLLALSSLPALAQINPKWFTTQSPDFLNLYQQSTNLVVKPEVVTVLDFSGSMSALMYHKNYLNDDLSDSNPYQRGGHMTFSRSGSTYSSYTVMGRVTADGVTYGPGSLVRPDGTVLTAKLINDNYKWQGLPGEPASAYTKVTGNDATWPSYYIQNWVRSASHVRVTYSSRTIDLPIPWTVLDDFSVQPQLAQRDTRKVYNSYPLKMTIQDPVTKDEVELDSTYRHGGMVISTTYADRCTLYTDPKHDTKTYAGPYLQWVFSSDAAIPQAPANPAFKNGLPARTRIQGVKEALLRTWIKYYDKVYWAFRGLQSMDDSNGTNETERAIFTDSNRGSQTTDAASALVTNNVYGNQLRKLVLMNSNSLEKMQMISHLFHGGGTPLTYAMANALAQFNDPNSVFNEVYDSTVQPQECTYHFLILFTDGQPSGDSTGAGMNSPYLKEDFTGDAATGNAAISNAPASVNVGGSNWNIMNMAAVAAHLGDVWAAPAYPASTWPSTGGRSVSQLLPFWVNKRDGKGLKYQMHPIQTMTVGVSLAGDVTSASGGKPRMFRAAALGDPRRKTWDLKALKPFQLSDPNNPDSKPDPNSVYFFDAADPTTLVNYLDKAFYIATNTSAHTSTTAPVLPTMGAGLGTQVYLGKFKPPLEGGPVWPGDLMMFPTREVNGATLIVDSGGNEITDALSKDNAQWSAEKILQARGWKNRLIYTRLPATTVQPSPGLTAVRMNGSTPVSDPGFQAIKGQLPGSDDAAKLSGWQRFVGWDGANGTRADAMGDIINSTPAVLTYSTLPSSVSSASGTLSAAWGDGTGKRFSMVFVGDNQGFLHAFGEVAWDVAVTDANGKSVKITTGVADELWAFVPTDLLPHIDYYTVSGNPHRYAVDGSPTAYLLDRPQGSTEVTGNGKYDVDATNELALVIFGLGKGGRSYYALDVREPGLPRISENAGKGWSLCPDEVANYPAGRFLADGDKINVIKKMGYSTSIPTPARMLYGATPAVKDFIFLGAGYSVPEVEAGNPTGLGAGTKLGRGIVAIEAATGNIARVWDFSSISDMGPVAAGVIPYEFAQGSGLHFRAYFNDYDGGLWALGSGGVSTDTLTQGFRTDSPRLEKWAATPRCCFKQAKNNGLVSTWPVPFSLPSAMPARTATPKVSPAAVGIAWVTGDRMNPLDYLYTSSNPVNPKPTQHRLNIFFDRQDSNLLGLDGSGANDGHMADFTSQTDPNASALDATNSAYYLKNKLGYYLNFVSAGDVFVTKGITPPQLLAGTLFFSSFVPTEADPCAGGSGQTNSYRVCDVMRPVFSNADASSATSVNGCKSGRTMVWTGVASRFAARSPVSVIQAGVNPKSTSGDSNAGGDPGSNTAALKVKSTSGSNTHLFLRPRVWRTVR